MADLNNSYYATSGNPQWEYQISYNQTGRTADTATYRVAVTIRMTNLYARFGYGITGSVNINGTSQQIRIKNPSPMWQGTGWQGTWYFDITAGAGTGGGTLPASFSFWGTEGASSPNISGNATVNLSAWNTAPYWNGGVFGINNHLIDCVLAENTGEVTITLPNAIDNEGNTIYFNVFRYVNGINTAQIAYNATDSTTTDNLSGCNQGDKVIYKAIISDGELIQDNPKWSYTYTINKLTGATISANKNITFDTEKITLTFAGASNLIDDSNFSYLISSSEVNIYNVAQTTAGTLDIIIWDGIGDKPQGVYIEKQDLINLVKNDAYTGQIEVNVQTQNAYGSKVTTQNYLVVDMRVQPTAPANVVANGYFTIENEKYYIPSITPVEISWNASTAPIDIPITYTINLQYDNGDWINVASNLQETTYQLTLPQITKTTIVNVEVFAVTSYTYTNTATCNNLRMEYWKPPIVSLSNLNRSALEFTIDVSSEVDTSIPKIAISDREYCYVKDGDTKKTWTSFTGEKATLTISNLTDGEQGTLYVKITDNSNIQGNSVLVAKAISPYIPILSVRKKGVGIGSFADDNNKFIVGGNAKIEKNLDVNSFSINGKNVFFVDTNNFLCINNGTPFAGVDLIGNTYVDSKITISGNEIDFDKGTIANLDNNNFIVFNSNNDYSGVSVNGSFWAFSKAHLDGGAEVTGDLAVSTNLTVGGNLSVTGSINGSFDNITAKEITATKYSIPNLPSDYAYFTAETGNDSVTTARVVVGDDENDKVCLSVNHWQTGMKDIISCDRDSINMNSNTTFNSDVTMNETTLYVKYIQGKDNECINVNIDKWNAIMFDAHSDRTQSRMWIDGHSDANGHAEQEFVPEQGSYGYVGTDSNYFYKMCACSFVNKSDRNTKTTITHYNDSVLDKIKNINVYLYSNTKKLGDKSNIFKEDSQDMKLGVMAQEIPIEITGNQDFTGVDVYALASFVLKGLKEEVKKREELEQELLQIKKQLDIISQNNKGADSNGASMQKN